MFDTTEYVIASDPHVALRVAKFIRDGSIPRTLHSEIEAKAEMQSRGFMMARYRLYRCELRGADWHTKELAVPFVQIDDNAMASA